MQAKSHWGIKFSLILTYFVFAILLNTVGVVILQVINSYGVDKSSASVLEGFKDLPIAIVSFLVASFLPRVGFRNSMMIGLAIVTLASLSMPLLPSFLTTKMLFLCVGVSFALVKVSIYSTVGLVTDSRRHHASFMNTLEGLFMVGVLVGQWLFSYFIDSSDPSSQSWLQVYYLIAGLCVFNIFVIASSALDESEAKIEGNKVSDDFVAMLKLLARPLVYIFVISAFLYVLIEQAIGTWLPTFNQEVLLLPAALSVMIGSIYPACQAAGRLSAGVLMAKLRWYPVLNVCLIATGALVLLSLPLTEGLEANEDVDLFSAPIAAYLIPLMGLFLAPVYPAINSVILSALPKPQHAPMTGLIVIFSALGGTTGSMITGIVFHHFDGQTAFYMSLIPLAIILVMLFFFKRETDKVQEIVEEST